MKLLKRHINSYRLYCEKYGVPATNLAIACGVGFVSAASLLVLQHGNLDPAGGAAFLLLLGSGAPGLNTLINQMDGSPAKRVMAMLAVGMPAQFLSSLLGVLISGIVGSALF